MSDKDGCLSFHGVLDTMCEDVLSNMGIYSTQWIIQEIDVTVGIEHSGETDPLLLTTAQVGAPLSDLRVLERCK